MIRLLIEGLKIASELGNQHIMIHYLLQMGIQASADGRFARGVLLISGAQHLFKVTGGSQQITDADGYQDSLAAGRAALGEAAFETLWSRGQALPLNQIVALALNTTDVPTEISE